MNKPLIGISCSISNNNSREIIPEGSQQLKNAYIKAVLENGGIPVLLPNGLSAEDVLSLCGHLDGFLFTGGADVYSRYYGKEPNELLGPYSLLRDETELNLLKYILFSTERPVFGICRGEQILNVALGGTLYIDLPAAGKDLHSFYGQRRSGFSHEIETVRDTRLEGILQGEKRVNSFHHQAVEKLGEGLIASAYSLNDRVIEAVEMPGERFVLGVQWHPEDLTSAEGHRRLFETFIDACRK